MTDDAATAAALHQLAHAVAAAGDDEPARQALAAVVHQMEHVTGAGLGSADEDPVVVLQRRFARAHLRTGEQGPRLEQVRQHLAALQRPEAQRECTAAAARGLARAHLLAEC